MLRQENVRQVHQLVRLLESGKQKVLFELFVVVFHEGTDDRGSVGDRLWRHVWIGVHPVQGLAVDQENALQRPVLAHEVFGRRDLLCRSGCAIGGGSSFARFDASDDPRHDKSGPRQKELPSRVP